MSLFAGRYQIQRPLGRGGIGEAFLVRDRGSMDRELVLKRVSRSAFPKSIESLRREFVTLTRLAHPNIARVEEFGEWGGFAFFVEEYVRGSDLVTALAGANYNKVLAVTAQVLRALYTLHRSDLLHGDLKPENVLIVEGASPLDDDAVKLIDFGLATPLSELGEGGRPSGSLPFMSPEVLLERPIDHRTDLYSLGVCLYRLLTGRLPFEVEGIGPAEKMRRQIEERPTEPRLVRRGIPRGLNDLVVRLLAKRPENRFPSAAAALVFLNQIEGERFPLWTESELEIALGEGPLWGREELIEEILKLGRGGTRVVRLTGPEGIGRRRIAKELRFRLELAGQKEPFVCSIHPSASPGEQGGTVVSIPPWSSEDVASFLVDRLRLSAVPASWRSPLMEVTGGIPRKVIEFARFLLAERSIVKEGERCVWAENRPPAGLTESIIRERQRVVSEGLSRELLRLCALARVPLSAALLARLVRRSPAEVAKLLDSLERKGWFRKVLHGGTYHYRLDEGRQAGLLAEGLTDLSKTTPRQLLELGEERFYAGDFSQAARLFDLLLARGAKELDKGLNRERRVKLFQRGAQVFAEIGSLERASDCCRRLSAMKPRGVAEQGELLNRWGWIDYLRGDYRQALDRFQGALAFWRKTKDRRHQASVVNHIGMACQRLGDLEGARARYRESLSFLKEEDPIYPVFLMNLATAAQAALDFQEAIASYERALAIAGKGNDCALESRLQNNLASLYLYLGKFDRASELAHASLKLAIENGLRNLEGVNHLLFAVIADREGDLVRFRESLEKAEAVFEPAGAAAERQSVRLHRAYYEFTAGHDDEALRRTRELRREIADLADSPLETSLDLLEGKIAARRDPPDLAGGRLPLERALRMMADRGDRGGLWEVCLTLARLWRRERPAAAEAYYEKAIAILDELAGKVPLGLRASFFRDRKQEKIREEWMTFKDQLKGGRHGEEGTHASHGDQPNPRLAAQP